MYDCISNLSRKGKHNLGYDLLPRDHSKHCQSESDGLDCAIQVKRTYKKFKFHPDTGSKSFSMQQVQKNDTVTVTLTGTLDNETIFDTIDESDPLVIQLGEEGVPKPIQRILLGMQVGEMRKVHLEAEEGEFGIRRSDLLQEIPKNQFTDKIEPKVGLVLSMNVEKANVTHQVPATIVEIKNDSIMIDYNHPLAGHPLNYEITVIEINSN